jgi:hypothetical protein
MSEYHSGMNEETHTLFLPLDRAATRLGIPAAWLKREAKAGRIPCLQAGRQLLFEVEAVAQSLSARASSHLPQHSGAEQREEALR